MDGHWGGAQWILAFWLVLRVTMFPVIGTMLKDDAKPSSRGVRYTTIVLSVATLIVVLWWGGFWG